MNVFNISLFFVIVCVLSLNILVFAHPTEYKLKKNKVYEAELVAVSSTVIPLSIYEVHSSLKFPGHEQKEKEMKPVGPLSLITSSNKKAHYQKFKSEDVSTVKRTT